jgi:hypothetical protein
MMWSGGDVFFCGECEEHDDVLFEIKAVHE